jgi:hypothetical protein
MVAEAVLRSSCGDKDRVKGSSFSTVICSKVPSGLSRVLVVLSVAPQLRSGGARTSAASAKLSDTRTPTNPTNVARNAQRLFAAQEPREKRRLLNFLLSNCTWEDGEVVATFREPFCWRKRQLTQTASKVA